MSKLLNVQFHIVTKDFSYTLSSSERTTKMEFRPSVKWLLRGYIHWKLINWSVQINGRGRLQVHCDASLPEFLAVRIWQQQFKGFVYLAGSLRSSRQKFLVKSPEMLSCVAWNFIMLKNILASLLHIYRACFVSSKVKERDILLIYRACFIVIKG